MLSIRYAGSVLCICLVLVCSSFSFAQPTPAPPGTSSGTPSTEAVQRLEAIQESLASKQDQLDALRSQLKAASDSPVKAELEQQIAQLDADIKDLNRSFIQIALGGIDMNVFEDSAAEQPFDWRKELTQIVRPVLDALKELTEKPRRIDRLKTEIAETQDQLQAIHKARTALELLSGQPLPDAIQEKIKALAAVWEQREKDTLQELEVNRFQLASLLGENTNWLQTTKDAVTDFLRGRGLTLLLALSAALGVWLVMRGLFWLYTKKLTKPSARRQSTRYRLIVFSFRALTMLVMTMSVLIVLYVAGDLLLLVLLVLILIGIGFSFKSLLPRYLAEGRLLLNIGPVREGERLLYNDIPWQVKTINMYSVLRNPELEGILRIPLTELIDLHSRPCGNEPWFPSRVDDYLLLPDGSFAQVLRQTPETVVLKTTGGMQVQYPSAAFIQLSARNLSLEGFGVAVSFGIDYRHQAISLEQVPQTFQQALQAALEREQLADHVLSVLVDFKEAAASSLDYLIFVSLRGEAAAQYFAIQRLVQKTCVAVCNREGWEIPFAQLTVHQGDGFERLAITKTEYPAPESS